MITWLTNRPRLLVACLLAVALLGAWWDVSSSKGAPQRIVLITLDTLRYDSLAGSDERPSSMPRTLARASKCLIFDNFYSSTSTTQPSHASLFTALHPWQHGLTQNGQQLSAELETIAERLKALEFETAAVVGSFPVSARMGFAQGFDEFDDRFTHLGGVGSGKWQNIELPDSSLFYRLASTVTDTAIAIVDRWDDLGKQFLWVHYFDPHGPYGDSVEGGESVRPGEILRKAVSNEGDLEVEVARARALYDRDVDYLDRSLERLFQRLEKDSSRLDTHVLVVADHGESFGEYGSMGHGKRLTKSQIHVPFFICSPTLRQGHRSDVAGSIDVSPTILSLAGDADASVAGRDLTAALKGPTRAYGMRRTFESPFKDLRLDGTVHILDHDFFYLVDGDNTLYRGNSVDLLDLPPHESPDDAGRLASRLTRLFNFFEEQLADQVAPELVDVEIQRALEALGYIH